jgi:hypothetical protein
MATAESMSTTQRNNLLVIKTHAAEDSP